MANFGFGRLAVVAPYAPHWREARSAVGAPELLKNAGEFATLAEAISSATLVLGTGTRAHRKPEQPVLTLPDLLPMAGPKLARGGRIAIVFGPEKHGLTRDDLSYCHFLVEIPTDSGQPSMNLGQAAAVCLYELANRITFGEASRSSDKPDALSQDSAMAATSGNLNLIADVIEKTMVEARHFSQKMRAANSHNLRLLLRRLDLSSADQKRILGLFRRILWRFKRTKGSGGVTE